MISATQPRMVSPSIATPKSVHVVGIARAMHLIGAGFEPVAQYHREGDHAPTWVFSWRSRPAALAYTELRNQLSLIPSIPVPPRSTRA